MTSPDHSPDVAIVGGGIIGLLSACELVAAGARVTVYDRKQIARESSWAGGGILSPLYPWRYPGAVTRLANWSQQRYPQLVQELRQETGLDPEYVESGLLISSPDEIDLASKWIEKQQKDVKLVDPEDIPEIQKGIATTDSPWFWFPHIAQVRNPRLLRVLRDYLTRKDVKIVENASISEIITLNGQIGGLQVNSETHRADRYLVAAGAWSGELLAGISTPLPIEPVKGQILLLNGPGDLLKRMVLRDSHYLIPRRDGRILVGSTLEYTGFDKSTTEAAAEELRQAAEDIYPGILDKTEVETQWAGLRPGSPEGVPWISAHPRYENLFVCSGHFRNGFVLGPASARLVVDLMLERAPILDADPYRLTTG